MAGRNLTKAAVERLTYDTTKPTNRQFAWDAKVRGFGCRVTPSGGKQYILSYRFNGRLRLMSLGPIAHFRTLDEARAKAQELLHDLRHAGLDPLAASERLSSAATVAQLWATYDREHIATCSANTRRVVASLWRAHIEPALGHLKPPQVTAGDLQRLHDRITKASGKVVANRVVQRLTAFFTWVQARDERLFPADWRNPAAKVKRHRELPREHHLDVEQMRALIEALEDEANPWIRAFVLMLMLTGARKDEIRTLTWDAVDLERRTATLAQTKNDKPMVLQLPPVAVEILRSLPVASGNPFVFPGRAPTQPMIEPRYAYKAALRRAKLPLATTFHDLRRSYGTALARQGASAQLVARALNNTSDVAARVYIQLAANDVRRMAERNAELLLPARQS